MLGKSQVVDLTQTENRPLEAKNSDAEQGEAEKPAEPPARFLPNLSTQLAIPPSGGKGKSTVAEIPARELLAPAVMVDVSSRVRSAANYRVSAEDLQAWEKRSGRIPKGSMVLLNTGWSRRWNGSDPSRYLNLDSQGAPHVPGLSPTAILFLKEREVRGVGLDTWIPQEASGNGKGPSGMLSAGKWQLVNLTNLERLPAKGAKLLIAPLRLEAGSAPARVLAILP